MRKSFELYEWVVAALFLIVAAADLFVIYQAQAAERSLSTTRELVLKHEGAEAAVKDAESYKERWEITHQVIQSLFLTTATLFTILMLNRWYRHNDEMKEAIKESTEKVLKALNVHPLLVEKNKAGASLLHLVESCGEILRKNWPEFVEAILVDQIGNGKSKIDALKGGSLELDLETAHRYSPKFFTITKGPSFVTASARNLGYWRTPDGRAQLAANKQAIKAKYGSITRAFIVPKDQSDLLHADIIQEQLNAGVNLIFVNESDVKPDFLCDVGVFLQPCESEVSFMSEWPWPNGGQKHQPARLTFDGPRLQDFGHQVYSYFRAHEKAVHVNKLAQWEAYKKQAGQSRN